MRATPGPWTCRDAPDDMGLEVIGPWQGHTRAIVAEVERDQDARLIAAAPEMLEMLRYCAEWLQGSEPHRAKAVNEVIANATGGQP